MGLATCHTKKTRCPKVKIPLNIQKGFFPRVLSRRVRKRDDATSTRPVDPDRWTGNCPLSFCDAGSLSYVSEKSGLPPFGSPFLPPYSAFSSSSASFLSRVCVQQIGGGRRRRILRQQCSRSSFRRLPQLLSVADNEECVALFQELLAATGLSSVIGN